MKPRKGLLLLVVLLASTVIAGGAIGWHLAHGKARAHLLGALAGATLAYAVAGVLIGIVRGAASGMKAQPDPGPVLDWRAQAKQNDALARGRSERMSERAWWIALIVAPLMTGFEVALISRAWAWALLPVFYGLAFGFIKLSARWSDKFFASYNSSGKTSGGGEK